MNLAQSIARLLDPTADARQPSRQRSAPEPGGLYVGRGSKGPVLAGTEHHVLVLGPPRSGKTSRLLVPALSRHRGPAVVTSTKADVIHSTIAARANLGSCWYWDPSGTTIIPEDTRPLSWSPVNGCDIWDQAVTRAHSLASAARPADIVGNHWVERAQALLATLLHAAAISNGELAPLLSWLHRRELLLPASILQDRGSPRAADLLQGIAQTDSRELSGIFSTADGILSAYRSDAAIATTRNSDFDPDDFAASTDTLYLVSPAAAQAVHAALIVALLDQLRTSVYRWHPQPAMLYALDEIANIAPLPTLPALLAEGGSQGLWS